MTGAKEQKRREDNASPSIVHHDSVPAPHHNSCGGCNACHQKTRIQNASHSYPWGGSDVNNGSNHGRSCATNFFQRNLGNSGMLSISGNQSSSASPIIQRKCSCAGSCPDCVGKEDEERGVQPKLKIGPVNDIYEQEADRVADQVMRIPDSSIRTEHQTKKGVNIKGKSTGRGRTAEPRSDIKLEHSGGKPLSSSTRKFMEPRFRTDLGQVRVHTDESAHKTASQIHARAFTYGNHIWLGKGESEQNRRLVAHELTHVVQQGGAQSPIPNNVNRDSSTFFNKDNSHVNIGHDTSGNSASMSSLIIQRNGTCSVSNCPSNHNTSVPADIRRAIGYVNSALTAINQSPLSEDTATAMDWFFRDHSTATVDTIRARLTCIQWALNDTLSNNRYACHPEYDAIAYVSVGSPPVCGHYLTDVCLTSSYFDRSDRSRAETMIHECGHREGLSVGNYDDIYDHTARFMHISTEAALRNADSYAFFASSVVQGIPVSILLSFRPGAGAVFTPGGISTWLARLDMDLEFQHPVLSVFNPLLGLHFSVMGVPERAYQEDPAASRRPQPPVALLYSAIGGVRIGPARAGAAGAPYVSFFGGPGFNFGQGGPRIGAEAGVEGGYRWRWLDISVGARYLYGPSLPEGMEHMVQIGGTIGFTPAIF